MQTKGTKQMDPKRFFVRKTTEEDRDASGAVLPWVVCDRCQHDLPLEDFRTRAEAKRAAAKYEEAHVLDSLGLVEVQS
jgi:hypothetical protein